MADELGRHEEDVRPDDASGTAAHVKTALRETAGAVKDKARQFGQAAADRIYENREGVAGALDHAAATMHGRAANLPGGEKVVRVATSAADKLSATAEYVRRHEVRTAVGDLEALIRRYPGRSIGIAAFLAFLLGKSIGRSRDSA